MRSLVVLISIVALTLGTGVGLADVTDVQYDTSSNAKTGSTAVHFLSWTGHTMVNESNRFIAVGISLNHDTTTADPITVASVTWTVGTTTQDLAQEVSRSSDTGTDAVRTEIWSRIAPTVGTGTIKVVLNNIVVDDEVIDNSATGNTPVTGATLNTGPDGSRTFFDDLFFTGGFFMTPPVVPSSLSVYATVGGSTVTATDDGAGGLSGTGVASGSVTYSTGGWSITYSSPPDNGTSITGDYSYGKNSFSGTFARSRIEPGSVTITATVNSSAVSITDNGSGGLSGTNVTGTINYPTGAWTLDFTQTAPDNQNITADYESQNEADVIAGASTFYNVNQTNPTTNSSTSDGTGTVDPNNPYLVLSTAARQGVFGVVATTDPANSLTIPSAQDHLTSRWNDTNGTAGTDTRAAGCTGYAAGRNSEIEWNLGSSRKWAVAGINIVPPNTPTEARFAKARAFATEAGTLVSWRTAYEVRNLGFKVYREDEYGERVPLNRSLVAGSALFAGPSTALSVGRSYVVWDSEAKGGASPYWLEAVDLDGRTTWYGPFLSEPASGRERIPELGGMTPFEAQNRSNPPLTRLGRSSIDATSAVKAFDTTARRAADRVGGSQGQWRMAAAPAARILVDQAGWTRVTRTQLAAAGYDPGPVATSLQLINQGHEEAIRISGLDDGYFDMDDAIEFFAREIDTSSTGTNVYWLTEGMRPGRRMAEVLGDSGLGEPAATFPATVTLQDRSLYVAAVTKNGDRDNFYGPVVGADPVTQVLSVDALPVESGQQFSTLEIALQGVTTADHRVAVNLNGHDLDEMSFSGSVAAVRSYEIDASWLRLGDNEVTLQALDGDSDVSLTDYLSLTWQRPFVVSDDRLEMTAPSGSTVRVSGFTEEAIRLFDVSNTYHPVEIFGSIEQNADGTWAVAAVLPGDDFNSVRNLYAVAESRIGVAAGLEANAPSSWHAHDNLADMVIISHSDLMPSADQLAAYRSAHGVSTVAVNVSDLYDEFSWGIKDPNAIRAFLAQSAAAWRVAPRYVLLMGDASVDPRNYLGFGNGDLVPTKVIATNLLKTANDDWFADLDGDGLANLAVGRLPARSLEEADGMVAKIIGYEQDAPSGWWSENLTLVIDEVTGDFDFREAADALEALVPEDIDTGRIDLGTVDQGMAHQMIMDAFGQGRLLINYDGHGSQAIWASDDVFENEDALSLENGSKLPLVVAMNCLNGLFHDVYQDSLAEALLANPNGGAVMVWASSALTDPTGQDLMNQDLYRSLFDGENPAVGDAVLAAKANVTDQDTRNTWILFGDPSMRLKQ